MTLVEPRQTHLTPRRPLAAWVVLFVGLPMLLAAVSASAQGEVSAGYRIGPKDLIEIKVFEVPELNIERRVSEEGTVNLPLIGDIPVQGLTDAELADRLKAMLESRYVQRASVAVQIKEFRWTLLEALSAAGGLSDEHADKIYVLRRADNGLSDQIAVNVDDLMVRGDSDANIPIFANDLINVPARVTVTVFCLGEVAKPGAVEFQSTERITLLTAIARAGGLTDRASRTIQVKRRDRSGQDVASEVNYKRIVAGKDPDFELRSGDVVIVKESFF